MKIAVLASGRGSNFSAIVRAVKRGRIKAQISLLICDRPGARVLAKARRAKVKTSLVKREDFLNRQDFEQKIIQRLEDEAIDLIVLAGYMRLLSNEFVRKYKNRILNIHPSLLPAFKGTSAIEDAFNYGVKVTGVTVHFVDEGMDSGPIVLQQAVKIARADTLASLEARIHKAEHKLYPKAIALFAEGKLGIEGRSVIQ